jgi:hypothetical protein
VRVFVSWKGSASHVIAKELRSWLPLIVQAVKPFLSSEDTEKGTRWATEIATELAGSDYGIICLTPENVAAPWINFEAGALSKTLDVARVAPIVVGLNKSDVDFPLAQFQLTDPTRDDVLRLVRSINAAAGDRGVSDDVLATLFDKFWPQLELAFDRARAELSTGQPHRPPRTTGEMLEELVDLVRGQERRLARIERQARQVESMQLAAARSGIISMAPQTNDPYEHPLIVELTRLLASENLRPEIRGWDSTQVVIATERAPSPITVEGIERAGAAHGLKITLILSPPLSPEA